MEWPICDLFKIYWLFSSFYSRPSCKISTATTIIVRLYRRLSFHCPWKHTLFKARLIFSQNYSKDTSNVFCSTKQKETHGTTPCEDSYEILISTSAVATANTETQRWKSPVSMAANRCKTPSGDAFCKESFPAVRHTLLNLMLCVFGASLCFFMLPLCCVWTADARTAKRDQMT